MSGETRRRIALRVLLVAAAVALAGVVAGVFPIFESDLFWHLAAGRWMLEQGAIPRVDPFRFTRGGAPWIDHEWLFQIVVRGVERSAGLDGLIALRAAALGGFALLLFHHARRAGLGAGLAGLLALAGMLGVRPRFLVRPEIFTLFAVLTLVLLLDRLVSRATARTQPAEVDPETKDLLSKGGSPEVSREPGAAVDGPASGERDVATARHRRGMRVDLVGLVILVVLWVNFHGQALLAPGVAFLFLAGSALDARRESSAGRVPFAMFVGLPALLAAALLVNPYGWRLIEVPLGIARALGGLSAHNPEWMSSLESPQPYLYGGFAAVAALALAGRLSSGRWPAPAWGLPAAAMAVLALSGIRHQALFFALATPYAARCLAAIPDARPASVRRERALAVFAIAAAGAIALWTAAPPSSGPLRARHGGLALGTGIAPGRFPERMADVLASRPGVGPLYNELVHGGYLLWRLFPPRRVFVDGRMELEPELLGEIAAARPGRWSGTRRGGCRWSSPTAPAASGRSASRRRTRCCSHRSAGISSTGTTRRCSSCAAPSTTGGTAPRKTGGTAARAAGAASRTASCNRRTSKGRSTAPCSTRRSAMRSEASSSASSPRTRRVGGRSGSPNDCAGPPVP